MAVHAASDRSAPHPRILILHAYTPDFSWTRDLQAGIMAVLNARNDLIDYRVEYMDAKHYNAPDYREKLRTLYRRKYSRNHFDGVM